MGHVSNMFPSSPLTLNNCAVSSAILPPERCNTPCTGDQSQTCGGANALSVYSDPTFTDRPIQAKYTPIGCWTDGLSVGRTLVWPQDQVNGQGSLTTEKCLEACNAGGYPLAGTEYGGEFDTRALQANQKHI